MFVKFCRREATGRHFQVQFVVIFYFHFFQDGIRKLYKTKLSLFLLILKYYLANEIRVHMVRWTCARMRAETLMQQYHPRNSR
jgi:hypothetical protein